MRAVLQRVSSASVSVGGTRVAHIGPGLLLLVGLRAGDAPRDAALIAKKVLAARLFPDAEGRPWALSAPAAGLEILCVSQFTLYGRLLKPKPDFSRAMATEEARAAYTAFVQLLKNGCDAARVHDGVFGAMMDVALVNDGPVTIVVDSDELGGSGAGGSGGGGGAGAGAD
jgi:D-tyrosyl-tRNA(Tyr) deacylase